MLLITLHEISTVNGMNRLFGKLLGFLLSIEVYRNKKPKNNVFALYSSNN